MILRIGRRKLTVATYEEASKRFCEAREKAGFGASRMPNGLVFGDDGRQVAYVSYNGRVWPGSTYVSDATPLYDNRTSER